MRQLGYIEASARKQPASFYIKDKPTTSKAVQLADRDEKSIEIRQLKQQLKDSQLREQSYLMMIEAAEQEFKINIKKSQTPGNP